MSEDDSTNIRIKTSTWQELREYKDKPNKTWDDVLQELLEAKRAADSSEADEGNLKTAATAD
jgi:predicted CopG family antitoxin